MARVRSMLILVLLLLLAGCGPAAGAAHRGEVAPDFALKDLSGEEVRLSDYRGTAVLVHFWTTWCPSCRVEMPELQKAQASLGRDRLIVLAVNLTWQDNRQEVAHMVGDLGLTFPILLDEEGQVALTGYRVSVLPTSVFVDPAGKIYQVQVGPMTQAFVERLLEEMGR